MRKLPAALLLILAACGAPPAPVGSGKPAPDVELSLEQAPKPRLASWKELQGQVVVLDFWATWCEPCVDSIPHLNSLVERFKGRPVAFISVTDESKEKVLGAFLEKHPMKGWLAFDEGGKAFSAFAVRGRPQTFILDSSGAIVAKLYPAHLTAEALEDVLAGRKPREGRSEPLLAESRSDAILEVRISTPSGSTSYGRGPDGFRGTKVELRTALAQVCDLPEGRVSVPEALDKRYDIAVRVPEGARACDVLRGALEAALPLKVRSRRRALEVLVVKSVGAPAFVPTPEKEDFEFSYGGGGVNARKMSLPQILEVLEKYVGSPLIDETRTGGAYTFALEWDRKDPGAARRAFLGLKGLKVEAERRELETLTVEPAPPRRPASPRAS